MQTSIASMLGIFQASYNHVVDRLRCLPNFSRRVIA